jgi:hypothetical protein
MTDSDAAVSIIWAWHPWCVHILTGVIFKNTYHPNFLNVFKLSRHILSSITDMMNYKADLLLFIHHVTLAI